MKPRRPVEKIPRPYLALIHTCLHCERRWSQAARHPTSDCACGARVSYHEVQVEPEVVT